MARNYARRLVWGICKPAAIIAASAFLSQVTPLHAITYDFSGVVAGFDNYENPLVDVGASVSGSFAFNLSEDFTAWPHEHDVTYRNMLVDFQLSIDGHHFEPVDGSHGITSIFNDFQTDLGLKDSLLIGSPEMAGDMDIWRTSIYMLDRTAEMFDDISPDNLIDIELIEPDGVDRFLRGGVKLIDSSGPYIMVDWQTLVMRLPGDANLDGTVDALDLNALALSWRGEAGWHGGDFTADGLVDAADLNLLAVNWRHAAASPVPEPSGWAIGVLSVATGFMLFLHDRE